MATLTPRPEGERDQELWMQHAAGFILFHQIREHARTQMEETLSDDARAAAVKAIDDALYGLMMIIDGVVPGLRNDEHEIELDLLIRLRNLVDDGVLAEMSASEEGDGMCMGYHFWKEERFGSDGHTAVVLPT